MTRAHRLRTAALLVLLAVVAGDATAQDFLLDETPARAAPLPAGVQVQRDLHYGSADLQTLDVYRPAHAADAPLILMVHGGGWRLGDKMMSRTVDGKVARWVPRGFVFASANYGLLPRTPVTQQVDDVAHALAYVQQHAGDWGADPRKVILMGHSAGAHLVAVLAADSTRAKSGGAQPWLGTIVLDSAVLDIPQLMQQRHLRLYDAAFGSAAAGRKTLSPIDLLTPAGAPLLVVCSTMRPDDSCGQSQRFAMRANALGRRAQVREEALTHAQINATLGNDGAYTEAVESFMKSLDAHVRAQLEEKS
jgi:arylformamidase